MVRVSGLAAPPLHPALSALATALHLRYTQSSWFDWALEPAKVAT